MARQNPTFEVVVFLFVYAGEPKETWTPKKKGWVVQSLFRAWGALGTLS